MMSTPNDPAAALPGRPPVVDLATWQAARDELLVREKAHTREGDALAAARRRLPMMEFDGKVEVTGSGGPVPFLDLFQGRDELLVYKHMWWDGAPHQGQCEGCTVTAWHLKDAVYLNARGVSFAILTPGRWDEVASYTEFMGYTQPWYSVRDADEPIGGEMGHVSCFLRDGDRVFLTYSTTGRGTEAGQRVLRPAGHDALRPGRGVAGQPGRLARGARPVLVLALGRGRERHLGSDQPPRPAVDPPGRDSRGDPRSARSPSLTRLRSVQLSAEQAGHRRQHTAELAFSRPVRESCCHLPVSRPPSWVIFLIRPESASGSGAFGPSGPRSAAPRSLSPISSNSSSSGSSGLTAPSPAAGRRAGVGGGLACVLTGGASCRRRLRLGTSHASHALSCSGS